MPIEWLPDALDRLTGDVEPYEVLQVLVAESLLSEDLADTVSRH